MFKLDSLVIIFMLVLTLQEIYISGQPTSSHPSDIGREGCVDDAVGENERNHLDIINLKFFENSLVLARRVEEIVTNLSRLNASVEALTMNVGGMGRNLDFLTIKTNLTRTTSAAAIDWSGTRITLFIVNVVFSYCGISYSRSVTVSNQIFIQSLAFTIIKHKIPV